MHSNIELKPQILLYSEYHITYTGPMSFFVTVAVCCVIGTIHGCLVFSALPTNKAAVSIHEHASVYMWQWFSRRDV